MTPSLRSTLAALAVLALAGCAGNPLSPWRHATVVGLVAADAIPDGTDLQCVPPGTVAPGASVVLVRLRVGRSPYVEAFPQPADAAAHVGDPVRVWHGTCRMQDRR